MKQKKRTVGLGGSCCLLLPLACIAARMHRAVAVLGSIACNANLNRLQFCFLLIFLPVFLTTPFPVRLFPLYFIFTLLSILSLGFFLWLLFVRNPVARPGGHVNELEVTFEVVEKGRLSGGGVSMTAGRNEGTANLEFNFNNLTGRADRIDMKTTRSTESNSTTEVSYRLPVAGDVYWPVTFGYFKDSEIRQTSSHTQHTRGIFASYNTPPP